MDGRHRVHQGLYRGELLGLLIPAIDLTGEEGMAAVLPAAIGFLVGALFLYALDKLTPHLHTLTLT